MTVYSQNGWPANDRSLVKSWNIPGTTRNVTLQNGAGGYLLCDFAAWFDKNVEDIEEGQLDDWGYAERVVRGGTDLSNHASGTAIDINAVKHPLAVQGTFKPSQVVAIRKKLMDYDGVIRWGGDYTGRKDEMHFEINASPAQTTLIADRIREGNEMLSDADKAWLKETFVLRTDMGYARDQIMLSLGMDPSKGGPVVNGKPNPGLQPARRSDIDPLIVGPIIAAINELKGTGETNG